MSSRLLQSVFGDRAGKLKNLSKLIRVSSGSSPLNAARSVELSSKQPAGGEESLLFVAGIEDAADGISAAVLLAGEGPELMKSCL